MSLEEPSFSVSSAQLQRTELALLLCQYRAQRLRLAVRAGRVQPREARDDYLEEKRRRERQHHWEEVDRKKEVERKRVLELCQMAAADRQQRAAERRRTAERDEAEIHRLRGTLAGCLRRMSLRAGAAAKATAEYDEFNAGLQRKKESSQRKERRRELREFNARYVAERTGSEVVPLDSSTDSESESSRATPRRREGEVEVKDAAAAAAAAESEGELAALAERLQNTDKRTRALQAASNRFGASVEMRKGAAAELLRLPSVEAGRRDLILREEAVGAEDLGAARLHDLSRGHDHGPPPEQLEALLQEKLTEREERLVNMCEAVKRSLELRPLAVDA